MFELTQCRRSDENHFKCYRSLSENLEEARLAVKAHLKTKRVEICMSLFLILSVEKSQLLSKRKQQLEKLACLFQNTQTMDTNALSELAWLVHQLTENL